MDPVIGWNIIPDFVQVRPGSATPVITDTPENSHITAEFEGQVGPFAESLFNIVPFVVIKPDLDPVSSYRPAVWSLPVVEAGGKVEELFFRSLVDVHFKAELTKNIRKGSGVAERVEIICHPGFSPEIFREILTAHADIPVKVLRRWEVNIRL